MAHVTAGVALARAMRAGAQEPVSPGYIGPLTGVGQGGHQPRA